MESIGCVLQKTEVGGSSDDGSSGTNLVLRSASGPCASGRGQSGKR